MLPPTRSIDRRRHVFHGLTENRCTTLWKGIRKATGVPARFHDARHTGAATMAKAGVPLSTIQKVGGWRTLAMVARYTRFVPEGTPTLALERLVQEVA